MKSLSKLRILLVVVIVSVAGATIIPRSNIISSDNVLGKMVKANNQKQAELSRYFDIRF